MNMNPFNRKNGVLCCEDVSLQELANDVGTPFYVYGASALDQRVDQFKKVLAPLKFHVSYAVKANSNLAVLQRIFSRGAGADIVSGGELARVLKAGCPGNQIVFSGVGKTEEEMIAALDAGILSFQIESEVELEKLNEVAIAKQCKAPISLRVNPDVDSKTHPYIGTGSSENKFGIAAHRVMDVYRQAKAMPGIQVVGIGCHIGSQLPSLEPLEQAIGQLVEFVQELASENISLKFVDVGGGLAIDYGEPSGDESLPTFEDYGAMVKRALAPLSELNMTVVFEPGRVIVGPVGMLVSKVLYVKEGEGKRFMIVDSAMNDLLRPSLYQAHHPMEAIVDKGRDKSSYDVVGPVCESGDFFAKDRELPNIAANELIGIGACGAYGFTMSSTYNSRPKVAEVLVQGGEYKVVRPRESAASLFESEVIPEFATETRR